MKGFPVKTSQGRNRRHVASAIVVVLSVLGSMLLGTVASPASAVASAISVTPSSGPFVFTAGSAITPVTFSATGGGAITYVVAPSLPTPLALDTNTGILSGTPSAAVPDAPYTVTATDASDNSTSQVVVNISVVSAPPPVPGIAPNSQTITGTVGAGITPTSSFTPTALTAPLKFALNGILPAGLTMDVDTGIITGTPSVLAAALPFTITATDSSASPLQVTSSLSVTVTAGVLSPAAQAPVTGVAGVALASPTASYPVSPAFTYSVSPALPTGLTVSSTNGAISGTPAKALAATTFTIEQHDALVPASILATATVSITVDSVFPASPVTVPLTTGTSISPVISLGPTQAIATGLVAPITFTITPIAPTGLDIDPNTGVISGIPTVAAASTHVVTATDVNGAKATGTVKFILAGVPALTPSSQTINAGVGGPFSSSPLTAVSMTAPVKYTISPLLGTGLTLNANTGAVSGTPTAALVAGAYTITGTDALGATATATIVFSVTKVSLSAPVIGSVTPGSQPGSLIVYFSKPLQAPVGQTYTVKVLDANGVNLITSVPATSSPVTILNLTPGETYQIVVVANASGTLDMVESLPKAGTAATAKTAVTGTVPTGVVATTTSTPQAAIKPSVTVSQAGFVLATGSQASSAIKVFASKPPTSKPKKAPKVRVPINSYVSVVLTGVKAKGLLPISIKVGTQWALLGSATAKKGSLTLPAFASTRAGTYLFRIGKTPKTFVYLTLVIKAGV